MQLNLIYLCFNITHKASILMTTSSLLSFDPHTHFVWRKILTGQCLALYVLAEQKLNILDEQYIIHYQTLRLSTNCIGLASPSRPFRHGWTHWGVKVTLHGTLKLDLKKFACSSVYLLRKP